jgi:predicted nicotinamide N-methyase
MISESLSSLPPAPSPPPQAILAKLGPLVDEKVIIEGETFLIRRPEFSDRLLDQEAVITAFEADEYMPYWADLWPAARMLAKVIVHETWIPGTRALEVGCGLGLPGIVALGRGLKVTFSDYDACALHFAAENARVNGYEGFDLLQLDWRQPPNSLRVPVILASDLIYELRNVSPLVSFIKKVLAPGGVCLMTDQDRIPSHAFRETLAGEGLAFATQIVRTGEPGGRRLKGTLYRVRQPSFDPEPAATAGGVAHSPCPPSPLAPG